MMFLRAPPPSRSRYGHLNIPPTPGIPVRSGTVLGLLPEINENVNENDEVRQQTSTKAADIDEPQEATERLRICPVKVLASLSHLRIDGALIKPIQSQAPKAGGKADVEAAILTSAQRLSSWQASFTEYVAVKKLRFDSKTGDNQALAPFAHEVSLLNDLNHDNVVKIIGFVENVDNGIAWMVFTWEKNGNLREFVRSANWELPERVSLIDDIAMGLSYLHQRSPPICHGDLKSLNILVNSSCRAVITDFGSARAIDLATEEVASTINAAKEARAESHTSTGGPKKELLKAEIADSGEFITMTGPAWTVRWAAPELLYGVLPSLESDVWAFGWICWEAVTGNFPFDDENDVAVIRKIMTRDLPTVINHTQLNQIKTLCNLMEDCWKLDATERPSAMRCQQVLSFMDQTIPSGEGNGSATTRSSGLLHALGRIQLGNGVMDKAQEYFRESLEVSKSVGDGQGKARALNAIGDVYGLEAQYSKAEESYIQSCDLYAKIGDQLGFAQAVLALGDVYRMRSEYSKAEQSYSQSRDLFSEFGDHLGYAQAVRGLGEVYRMRKEYSKAEESCIQSRNLYSKIGDQLGFADSCLALGEVYRMQKDYSKAEESYIQSYDLYSKIGDQLGFAHSVEGLGHIHRMRNEYSKAEESYARARDLYSKTGDQLGLANSVKALGEVYHMRKDYSKAEEYYIQSRDLYAKIGDQLGVAHSVKALGEVYRTRSAYSKAEESFIQSRDLCSEIGDQLGFAQSLEGLGRVHSHRQEYAQAEKAYLEAQGIYLRAGAMYSLANILWYLGWLHRQQAQYGEADRLVREASTIYGRLGVKAYVADCDRFLADIRLLKRRDQSRGWSYFLRFFRRTPASFS